MDTNEKIHIELLKRIKIFSETYVSDKSHKSHKKTNYNHSPIIYPKNSFFQNLPLKDNEKLSILSNFNPKYKFYNIISELKTDNKNHPHEKTDSNKKSKRKFLSELKKMKKMDINRNINNSPKHNYQKYHHKNSQLINNFSGKKQICKDLHYKPQDKTIKLNLVNQKFKIADNFNEKNSNQFLKEKDECLKKLVLTDEIKNEEFIPFYVVDENENAQELSYIRKKEHNERDDSIKLILGLIEDLK